MVSNDGFMGFWADIDQDYVLRFQEWHSCEHMPERVGIAGFVEGRRYRGCQPGPMFFMCYMTETPDVLRSKAYLAALDRPTSWTQESLKRFRNPSRNIYRRVSSGLRAPGSDPYLVIQRFNDPRSAKDLGAAVEIWIANAGLPAAEISIALYEIDSETSKIMTAERAIYDGGPGLQGYLLTLGLRNRTLADQSLQNLTTELRGQAVENLEGGLFWLETRITKADIASSAP